jgi:hypothetical protein
VTAHPQILRCGPSSLQISPARSHRSLIRIVVDHPGSDQKKKRKKKKKRSDPIPRGRIRENAWDRSQIIPP